MTTGTGELEDYSILVTGGGTGIGAGIALRIALEGGWVTICGRTEETLRATTERINAHVGRAAVRWRLADVTEESDVRELVANVATSKDGLDGVVANAGGGGALLPMHLQDVTQYERVLKLNVIGTLLLTKYAVPVFARKEGGGSFVAISSIAGHVTHPYFGAYPVSKAAVEELVRNAADEYGEANIRFNAVRPGLTLTDSMAFVTPESPVYQSYDVNTPMGDGSEVDDVAQLVSFLLSRRAHRMTGQVINVDGGLSLRRGPDWSTMVEPRIGGHEVALGRRDPDR
jgi:7-alpha-hydroxysteroid dehydrogenase